MGRDGTKNLKPVRTKEEARERGRNGGIASGKARREKRNQQELAQMLLSMPINDGDLDEFEGSIAGLKGRNLTGGEVLLIKQFSKAMKGDTKAYEVVRDTAGEQPVQRFEVASDVKDAEEMIDQQIEEWRSGRG